MAVQVIAIGEEVLSGMVVNTNAAFISAHLVEMGLSVERHLVLPDDPELLTEGLKEALSHTSIVIATGGLGPTEDDHTSAVAAALFHSDFYRDENVAAELAMRYGKNLSSLENQATVPSKAQILINKVGTAPGLIFQDEGRTLILLPGIPPEMQAMFLNQVIPYLRSRFCREKRLLTQKFHLCLLSENVVDPFLKGLRKEFSDFSYGIYPGYGMLSVVFSAKTEKIFLSISARFKKEFQYNIFSAPSGKISEALQEVLIQKKLTLACAESCTGGMIAAQITANPGASTYFLGSLVAYSNEFKMKLLKVRETTLKERGDVSSDVVQEMLEGLFKATSADFGIAVTGIAGPSDGDAKRPVGTIWAAIAQRGKKPDIATFRGPGNRETIILSTANRLLGLLWRKIVHEIPADSF